MRCVHLLPATLRSAECFRHSMAKSPACARANCVHNRHAIKIPAWGGGGYEEAKAKAKCCRIVELFIVSSTCVCVFVCVHLSRHDTHTHDDKSLCMCVCLKYNPNSPSPFRETAQNIHRLASASSSSCCFAAGWHMQNFSTTSHTPHFYAACKCLALAPTLAKE